MDWNHASVIRIGEAFAISLMGLIVVVLELSRFSFTVWGRQFRRVTWAYFNPFTPSGSIVPAA